MNSTNISYHPIARIGLTAQVLIGLAVVLDVTNYICSVAIQAYFPSENFSTPSAIVHIISNLAYALSVLLKLIASIVFAVWMSSSLKNLPTLNAPGAKYKGWYSWSVFAPILNLFLPMLILQEIWKGSDPSNLDPSGWRKGHAGKLIYAAWITGLAAAILGAMSKNEPQIEIIAKGLFITACVLAIRIIAEIGARQETKLVQVKNKVR